MKPARGNAAIRRIGITALCFVFAVLSAIIGTSGPAHASALHRVFRTCTTPGGCGMWLRDAPAPAANHLGLMWDGDAFNVSCWVVGPSVYGDPIWLQGSWNGRGGWAMDYYIDTHWNTTQDLTNQGMPWCGSVVVASAPVPPTWINGRNVGYPQNGWHGWGYCTVRDYKGGQFDWTIASTTAGMHIVHNGMLWGWFDNGGAAGSLRCPTSDEYGWNYGVRQDFQGGSLYWHPGMDHAARTSAAALSAINWAAANMYDSYYQGQCLAFIQDAYGQAGVNLHRGLPSDYSADQYARYSGYGLNGSVTPPPGAVVLWYGTADHRDGHVAISIGGGYAISTTERQYPSGHIMSIAERNATKPYAGWFMP